MSHQSLWILTSPVISLRSRLYFAELIRRKIKISDHKHKSPCTITCQYKYKSHSTSVQMQHWGVWMNWPAGDALGRTAHMRSGRHWSDVCDPRGNWGRLHITDEDVLLFAPINHRLLTHTHHSCKSLWRKTPTYTHMSRIHQRSWRTHIIYMWHYNSTRVSDLVTDRSCGQCVCVCLLWTMAMLNRKPAQRINASVSSVTLIQKH